MYVSITYNCIYFPSGGHEAGAAEKTAAAASSSSSPSASSSADAKDVGALPPPCGPAFSAFANSLITSRRHGGVKIYHKMTKIISGKIDTYTNLSNQLRI